jgi:hypothetical protein
MDKKNFFEISTKKFPDFKTKIDIFLNYWVESPGLSLELGEFADYIVEKVQHNASKGEVKDMFDFVEDLLVNGDAFLKDATATTLLESIMNAVPKKISGDILKNYLGDKSREYCQSWDKFNGTHTDGVW